MIHYLLHLNLPFLSCKLYLHFKYNSLISDTCFIFRSVIVFLVVELLIYYSYKIHIQILFSLIVD